MRAAGLSICGTLAVLAVCIVPTPAAASGGLEPGVHLDPGSPAEKQYVLPLSQARQTGQTGSARQQQGGGLFGAGITPPRGGGGGTSRGSVQSAAVPSPGPRGARGAHSRAGSTAAAHTTTAHASAPLPVAVLRAARSQDSSDGSGSWLALLGGGLAIFVLGGFGGTVLRHSRRPTPSS